MSSVKSQYVLTLLVLTAGVLLLDVLMLDLRTSEGNVMPIITIASSKGGPGKSTLAQLIAGILAAEGISVTALDADPTGCLHRWVSRIYEGPTFACHHEAEEARLAHLIHRVAKDADVVIVDTAGFGNRAATVAMTAADVVLIPMIPGEGDVTEATRTVELVAGVAAAARREIPARVMLNRVRPATTLSKHAATEAASLPRLNASLSDLVAYGEIGFSGRMPTGKAAAEVAALVAELRDLGWLPTRPVNTSSSKTLDVKTSDNISSSVNTSSVRSQGGNTQDDNTSSGKTSRVKTRSVKTEGIVA
jgi:chromosome partitioning protein